MIVYISQVDNQFKLRVWMGGNWRNNSSIITEWSTHYIGEILPYIAEKVRRKGGGRRSTLRKMNGFAPDFQPVFHDTEVEASLSSLGLCDIGFNISDDMFHGKYHHNQAHESDFLHILERAKSCGVISMLCTSSFCDEAEHTIRLCRDQESNAICRLRCTVGVHPCRATEFSEGESSIIERIDSILEEGVRDGIVVAVGECGLDYDRFQYCGKELQLIAFQAQLPLATKYNLPLFLHNRNTEGDFLRIMKENIHLLPAGGVVHSYTDSLEEMLELAKLGLYIGVNGCSIRTEEGIRVVQQIPSHLLLLETDSPWCSIKPTHPSHKHISTSFKSVKKEKFKVGSMIKDRNEPCHMLNVLEAVAKIRQIDPITLAQQVHENTKRLFPTLFSEY